MTSCCLTSCCSKVSYTSLTSAARTRGTSTRTWRRPRTQSWWSTSSTVWPKSFSTKFYAKPDWTNIETEKTFLKNETFIYRRLVFVCVKTLSWAWEVPEFVVILKVIFYKWLFVFLGIINMPGPNSWVLSVF